MQLALFFLFVWLVTSKPAPSAPKIIESISVADFPTRVLESNHMWVVEFSSSATKASASRLKKELEKAASSLKGICQFGMVDVAPPGGAGLVAQFRLVTLPTVRFFAKNMGAQVGHGDIVDGNKQAIAEYVTSHVVNWVDAIKDVSDFDVVRTVGDSPVAMPQVVLFTDKKATTLLYKAVAAFFHGRMWMREVRGNPTLMQTLGITAYPTLMVLKEKIQVRKGKLTPLPLVYSGPLSYSALVEFLSPHALTDEKVKQILEGNYEQPKVPEETHCDVLPVNTNAGTRPSRVHMGMVFDARALTEEEAMQLTGTVPPTL